MALIDAALVQPQRQHDAVVAGAFGVTADAIRRDARGVGADNDSRSVGAHLVAVDIQARSGGDKSQSDDATLGAIVDEIPRKTGFQRVGLTPTKLMPRRLHRSRLS